MVVFWGRGLGRDVERWEFDVVGGGGCLRTWGGRKGKGKGKGFLRVWGVYKGLERGNVFSLE